MVWELNSIYFFYIYVEISRKMMQIKVVKRTVCHEIRPVKISNFLIVFELRVKNGQKKLFHTIVSS